MDEPAAAELEGARELAFSRELTAKRLRNAEQPAGLGHADGDGQFRHAAASLARAEETCGAQTCNESGLLIGSLGDGSVPPLSTLSTDVFSQAQGLPACSRSEEHTSEL